MPITRSLFLLIAAVICFVIALLLTLGEFSGGNVDAWGFGGLVAFAASFIP